jgi:hypothetical protein
MLGTALERWAPVSCQSTLIAFGAFWVAMAGVISAPWNYFLVRSFIGDAGSAFLIYQFWCSRMFSQRAVGARWTPHPAKADFSWSRVWNTIDDKKGLWRGRAMAAGP